MCCRTASFMPPLSFMASPSKSARTFPSTIRTCGCLKCSTSMANRWPCGIAITSNATAKMAARGWMFSYRNQSCLACGPWYFNVADFTKPAPGQPALISFSDVTTMFHEFGHALHGMFANTEYPSLSGTSVARDYVEFPSQFNEHWATYPAVFEHYAKHYQTGASMPAELAAKVTKAEKFNVGYDMTEVVAAAELDMQWHLLPAMRPCRIRTSSKCKR